MHVDKHIQALLTTARKKGGHCNTQTLTMHDSKAHIFLRGQLAKAVLKLLEGGSTPHRLSFCISSSSNSLTDLLLEPINLQALQTLSRT